MQCFTARVQDAIRTARVASESSRFALLRMAELLDEAAPIGVSAALLVDSQTAVEELRDRLQDYADSQSPYGYVQVERAVADATNVIRRDPALRALYGATTDAVLVDLRAAEAIRRMKLPVKERGLRFAGIWRQRLSESLERLHTAVTTAPNYRTRIRERVLATLGLGALDRQQWNRFDGDLGRMCSGLLAEGRHGPSVIDGLAAELVAAQGAPDLQQRWDRVLAGVMRSFEVVVFIDGMVGRRDPNGDDFSDLPPERLTWALGTPESNAALTKTAATLVSPRRTALRTRIEAADAGQARRLAFENAETVVTRILHEHRVGDIDLLVNAVVFDPATESVSIVPPLIPAITRARVSSRGELSSLLAVMHYFGMARRDSRALSANVNLWTALESLSKGDGQTRPIGAFVPEHIGPIVALVAARQVFSHSRWLLQRELSRDDRPDPNRVGRWLGYIDGNGLRRWNEVLLALTHGDAGAASPLRRDAAAEDAAHSLRELLDRCSFHVRRRIDTAAFMVSDRRRLISYLDSVAELAAHQSDRMRVTRNRTVHNSLITVGTAQPLRQTGLLLVDAVLELLPHWTRPDEPPHRAMHRTLVWRGNLRSQWARGSAIDPKAIVVQP
ncbi:MAG TPA: hypothetical protein VLK58_18625 [Conexibacter sp.]|nr:hypothetical protein [Conexibacter sp.]